MKKLLGTIFAALILLAFGSLNSTRVDAGPFLKQGHWVPLANGGAECMTHWWNNDCKVGDIREPGMQ
jgi:hypothetical protein